MKKKNIYIIFRYGMWIWIVSALILTDTLLPQPLPVLRISDVSLKNEVQHSIEKGLDWLKSQQNPGGWWSQQEYPALTGLVLTACMGSPSETFSNQLFIQKGYSFILSSVKPDGGIYGKDLSNYNTAVCITALQVSRNPAYVSTIRKARNFLVGLQSDSNGVFTGGVGYGNTYSHSDLSNTVLALEALYYTKYMEQDAATNTGIRKLDWKAAIEFVQNCQNLPEYNKQSWASDDSENRGGFVYFPGNSKAGETELPSSKVALRSYGSISYAGLLSYIYADLGNEDPRVKAVLEWLQKHYTLEENPGMEKQGLYYYYHTMAKALSICGIRELVMQDRREIDWRKDLALKLFDLQDQEGFWRNENGRWWERDPVLVTCYALIALEIVYRGL